ncbi:MAG: nuclear transport factor 2 family protein [Candidatus Latescibacteria bacterium]|nr:nuclear transport factor 2 family protein [Candidatus Latescibacterota bacterium]
MDARKTVHVYFDALTLGDARRLIALMSRAPYYVKIGTDENEYIQGGENISEYYQHHVDSTEDFTITCDYLDVQEREAVAWFYTRQTWTLKWQGQREQLAMRLTGVLEKEKEQWKFVQIHASLGVPESGDMHDG